MSNLRTAIDAAKARLPLPMLLAELGLEPHARRSARCPLHEDQHPSFSVFLGERGWRWKCHAGCGEGDEIGFLEAHLRITRGEAVQRFCAMGGQVEMRATLEFADMSALPSLGAQTAHPSFPSSSLGTQAVLEAPASFPSARSRSFADKCVPKLELGNEGESGDMSPHSKALRLPEDARPLTTDDCDELAALRRISSDAPWMASRFGTLFLGTVGGFRCWIVTDERRLCAEARRMDGQHFPAIGSLGERKAHTLRGSVKSWPVGLAASGFDPATVRAWLAVEGGPDYLAALHFILGGAHDCLPLAFLGAGTVRALHPEALDLLRGRRVRFYPHADANGAGQRAVHRWCGQLRALDCTCDAVDFTALPALDGTPIKDLNDCTRLEATHAELLKGILP